MIERCIFWNTDMSSVDKRATWYKGKSPWQVLAHPPPPHIPVRKIQKLKNSTWEHNAAAMPLQDFQFSPFSAIKPAYSKMIVSKLQQRKQCQIEELIFTHFLLITGCLLPFKSGKLLISQSLFSYVKTKINLPSSTWTSGLFAACPGESLHYATSQKNPKEVDLAFFSAVGCCYFYVLFCVLQVKNVSGVQLEYRMDFKTTVFMCIQKNKLHIFSSSEH